MMNHSKKALPLTIVIPAYNEAEIIGDCLDNIASQIVKPDQVIVIDNNSTDKTAEIAASYKFVTVVSEAKQGIAHARNTGFDMVDAGIIARIDADTVLPETWVQDIKDFYNGGKNIDSVLTGTGYFINLIYPPRFVVIRIQNLIAFRFNRLILGHYILWGSNMAMLVSQWRMVRKEVCNNGDIHEDLDLAIHLHRQGIRIVFDPYLVVGVVMKRVLNDWTSLYANMMWWPRTLKVHNNRRWILGLVGAYFLLAASSLVLLLNKPPLYIRKLANNRYVLQVVKSFK